MQQNRALALRTGVPRRIDRTEPPNAGYAPILTEESVMVTEVLWGVLLPFFGTSLGAACVFFLHKLPGDGLQRVLLGFAAGVMAAASVWSLLIPAIERAAPLGTWAFLPAAVGLWLGVLLLYRMDKKAPESSHTHTLTLAVTLHNVPEGMAVGLAFALAAEGEGMAGAAALALGIGIQNLPEGAAISLPLRQEGSSRGRAFLLGTLSGSVEPIFGILVVLVAAGVRPLMPWLLSFAAGAMLYVVVEELVPQAHSKAGTCGFVGGFLIMMILDVALG